MGPSSWPSVVLSPLLLRALRQPQPTPSPRLTSSLECSWPWGAGHPVRLPRETSASFPNQHPSARTLGPPCHSLGTRTLGFLTLGVGLRKGFWEEDGK